MHRDPQQVAQAPLLHVQQGRALRRDRDVDVLCGQGLADLLWRVAREAKGDDAATLAAQVVECDTGQGV